MLLRVVLRLVLVEVVLANVIVCLIFFLLLIIIILHLVTMMCVGNFILLALSHLSIYLLDTFGTRLGVQSAIGHNPVPTGQFPDWVRFIFAVELNHFVEGLVDAASDHVAGRFLPFDKSVFLPLEIVHVHLEHVKVG